MSRIPPVLRLTIVLAVFAVGTGWSDPASAQGKASPALGIEIHKAQRDLIVAEAVLRDARAARVKTEAAVAERLARIEEMRRNARALPDNHNRREALRAAVVEEANAHDERDQARATEAAAERNAEAAALALARARTAAPPAKATPVAQPPAKAAVPPATKAKAAAPPPPPAVSLDDLILARIDVESAEVALARAKTARANIERDVGAEVRELTRRLADAVEQRKRVADAQATALEARLKAGIQEATAKVGAAQVREAEAGAVLEAARAREVRVQAEIGARLKPAR